MALSGWIKLHRAIADHHVSSDPASLSVWIYLLIHANHTETKRQINGRVLTLHPGQLITSRKSISEKTGVQQSKVERILRMLLSEHQIEQHGSSKFRLISIVKWAEYQGGEQENEQQLNSSDPRRNLAEISQKIGRKSEQQMNSRRPATAWLSEDSVEKSEQQVNSRRTTDEQQMNTPGEVIPIGITQEGEEGEEKIKSTCPQRADDQRPKITYAMIQAAYNEICSPTFPACAVMNDKRKRQIKAMGAIDFMGSKPFTKGIEVWRQYFTDCLTNSHWCGQNDRGWRADFDHVTNPKNAIKIMERMN